MANTVYANKVIEAKAKDLLTTKINTRSLMTIDDSLTQEAGMTKTINTYTYTGEVEALAAGAGNTSSKRGSIAYVGKDYTVNMNQGVFDYRDEDFLKDPVIVDFGVKGATQAMANKMTADFVGQVTGTGVTLGVTFAKNATISYDVIVDAISKLNIEDEANLFVLIPNAWKAGLRKDADYISARQGEVVYNGQIGTVCGLPVVASKALSTTAFVMSPEAVTCFMKKDVEAEQDRDSDTRTNSVYLRSAYVVALTDATKICKITEASA